MFDSVWCPCFPLCEPESQVSNMGIVTKTSKRIAPQSNRYNARRACNEIEENQ
jgi:hypothetical protein